MKKFNLQFAILSVIVDIAMIMAALIVAYEIRSGGEDLYLWPLNHYLAFVSTFIPVWLILFVNQGLYRLWTPLRGWTAVARVTTALLSGWGVMLIYLYLSRSPEALVFPRLIIAYGVVFSLIFVLVGRILVDTFRRFLNNMGYGLIRTFIVINSDADGFVRQLHKPFFGRQVVGVATSNYLEELKKTAVKQKIDEVIVAQSDLGERATFELLDWAESNFVNFVQVPTLLSVRAINIETGTLAGTPVLFYKQSPLDGWGRVFKRILDLLIVIPVIVVLSPLLIFLFILAQLSTGRGIITQERIGQDGRVFKIHKFRSMYIDGDERFPEFKGWSSDESKDPRITPIGRVLRKTNLDELPQLWDVLIGTMSLVGPRPEQPKYVEKFSGEVPDYVKRHHVKSGLTGWAQINGLRGNTPIPDRVKYDLYYIENWSIWFDLRIIIGTAIYVWRQLILSK